MRAHTHTHTYTHTHTHCNISKPEKGTWQYATTWLNLKGFPDSSVGKEPVCNAGNPSLIPGWVRSTGERIGYPLQYPGLENSMGSQRIRLSLSLLVEPYGHYTK